MGIRSSFDASSVENTRATRGSPAVALRGPCSPIVKYVVDVMPNRKKVAVGHLLCRNDGCAKLLPTRFFESSGVLKRLTVQNDAPRIVPHPDETEG